MAEYQVSEKYKPKEKQVLANMEHENWVHFKLKPGEKIFMCKKCLTLSTRPRAMYDDEGVCNACRWAEAKKKIDWKQRWETLEELCDHYRKDDGTFDCIVPGSGGKDSTTVAWKMKHELDMNPLCVTFAPQMPTEVGQKNLENWINSGFDHIMITPNPEAYRKLSIIGFKEEGRPKMPFVTGITTAIVQIAIKYNLPFIMYGEQGETEYGGDTSFDKNAFMDRQETIDVYFSGYEPDRHLGKLGLTKKDLSWWQMPAEEDFNNLGIKFTFWSWFEDWDPYDHYLFAKKHAGFQELPTRSIGTYTNFAQLDDDLQDLHAFMMFIKFGFGRAWSDACIDIRRGAMDRKQAIALVKAYDGEIPEKIIPKYCEYFEMTEKEFWDTIDSFRSPDIFEKKNGEWKLKFDIDELANQ